MKKTLHLSAIAMTAILVLSFPSAPSAANAEFEQFNNYIIELKGEPLARKKATLETPGFSILQQAELYKHEKNLRQRRQQIRGQIEGIFGNAGTGIMENREVSHEFEHLFNGMAISNISGDEAKMIEALEGVKKVWIDEKVEISLATSVPLIQEGIAAGNLDIYGDDCDVSEEDCLTGEGIKIAILDTGVDYTHADFGECTTEEFLDGECEKVIGGWDFITCENFLESGACAIGGTKDEDDNPMDQHGHGTHVASIAAGNGEMKGVATGAEILAYRVLNSRGQGTTSWVVKGVEKAVEEGADILNLSLGGPGNPDDPLSTAVDNAVLEGAVVVVAAGNSGPSDETIRSPGMARKAITVGATNKSDVLASLSSRGPVIWGEEEIMKPDLVAPGVSIQAALWGGGYTSKSGTSMAAPHVAGAAALLKQRAPDLTTNEIKEILKSSATDLGYEEKEQGDGRINIQKAVKISQEYTLTADVNNEAGGIIEIDPTKDTYAYNEEVTLTAEPEEEWSFSHWSGDLEGTENPITIIMDGNKSVTANFLEEKHILTIDIEGEGTIVKTPEKLAYNQGDEIEIKATPDLGWSFSHWSGDTENVDDPDSEETFIIIPDKDVELTAHFTQDEYTLAVHVNEETAGSVEINPMKDTYLYGEEITLTAEPEENWVFSNWEGALTGSTNPKVVIMDDDKEITANFTQGEHTLVISTEGNGTADKTPDKPVYAVDESVDIEATPDSGWSFSHWSGDTENVDDPDSEETFIIIPDKDVELTAHFTQDEYTLAVNVNGGAAGNVVINPENGTYLYGEEVTLTAEGEEDFVFSHWSGDFEGTENPAIVAMDGNKEITANFEEEVTIFDYHEVAFDKNGGDTEADPSVISVEDGESVEELPIPPTRTGYTFIEWNTETDGTGTEFTEETPVTEDITVYAIWTADTSSPPSSPPPDGGSGDNGDTGSSDDSESDNESDDEDDDEDDNEQETETQDELEEESSIRRMTEEQEEKFKDTRGHWGEEYINTLSKKCDVQGYTDAEGNLLNLFGPNNPVTRAELVKMVVGCIEEETPEDGTTPFSDVEKGKWYTPYILLAALEGWIEGYADGTFKPGNNINRVEALKVILLSEYEEEEIKEHEYDKSDIDFTDINPNGWYIHYFGFSVSKGFVSGYTDAEGNPTGYFGPSNNLTRAEAAKIITEALGL